MLRSGTPCRLALATTLATVLAVMTATSALAQAAATYSGQATVLRASVAVINVTLGDTGPLPSSGGERSSNIAGFDLPGIGSGGAGRSSTQGEGSGSTSSASIADLALTPLGIPITANAVQSEAEATCQGGTASTSGSTQVVGLNVNGTPIVVSLPNLRLSVAGLLTVVVNEQIENGEGDLTVNALHVTGLMSLVDITVASSHADVTCA
jgi:hypothetical protein